MQHPPMPHKPALTGQPPMTRSKSKGDGTAPPSAQTSKLVAEIDALIAQYQGSAARKRLPHNGQYRYQTLQPVEAKPITYACAACKDQGVAIVYRKNGKQGWDGRRYDIEPCQCKRAEMRERKAQRIRSASNLTAEMAGMTFATFEQQRDQDAFDAAQTFITDADAPPFLLLSGTYGSGKTHLLAAIAHEAMRQGRQPLFTVVPSLLDWFRQAFGQKQEKDQLDAFQSRFDGICNADILLLDDLGAEKTSEWTSDKLFQLINHRYTNHLPTAISTNCTLRELEGRIRSRLADVQKCARVVTVESDFRQSPARKAKKQRSIRHA